MCRAFLIRSSRRGWGEETIWLSFKAFIFSLSQNWFFWKKGYLLLSRVHGVLDTAMVETAAYCLAKE